MIKSMTAFGCASVESPLGQWRVEVHSVNRKMLDIAIHIPKELLRFDIEIRQRIAQTIYRGQITVRIQPPLEGSDPAFIERLHHQKLFWDKAALALGRDPHLEVSLTFLVNQLSLAPKNSFLHADSEIKEAIQRGLEQALIELQQMKEVEGRALLRDIEQRLHLIAQSCDKVSKRCDEALIKYRLKLEEKLKELPLHSSDIETRILQEIIMLTEKRDITEELTRLYSHLEQFKTHLHSNESVGRTLDFLTQELNREVNTIASKCSMTEEVIYIKSEIEKIREQVQNIE